MLNDRIKRYAKLIALKGIGCKKGRNYLIECNSKNAFFAEYIANYLYKFGANDVFINYSQPTKAKIKYSDIDNLKHDSPSSKTLQKLFIKGNYGRIVLTSPTYKNSKYSNDYLLKEKEYLKFKRKSNAKFKAKYMDNELEWCIAAVPNSSWAKKVFPNLPYSVSKIKLWDAILSSCNVLDDNDEIDTWTKHNESLKKRAEFINNNDFVSFHYTSKKGTDLTIGMVENYIFEGGTSFTPDGNEFDANMPTEEIFSMPHKDKVNGIVYATKPLYENNTIFENFAFKFKDGKVEEIIIDDIEKKKKLEELITTDENACRLGEIAFVSNSSPINKTNLLFFNTLFDENASCHLALGQSYSTNLKNGLAYSKDELLTLGANQSLIHVDFMVGDETLNIIGKTKKGQEILIMKDGEFVF